MQKEIGDTGRLSFEDEATAFQCWDGPTIRRYHASVRANRRFFASLDILTNEELSAARTEVSYAAYLADQALAYGNENYRQVAEDCRALLLKAEDKLLILAGNSTAHDEV
jgi:hypothetical protein